MSRRSELLHGPYVILDVEAFDDVHAAIDDCLAAGIRLFQYRAKRNGSREDLQALHAKASVAGALLLVNDKPDWIEDADGVHLGQDDFQTAGLAQLRVSYPGKIIGISAHHPDHLIHDELADYYGVGPYRPSRTKAVGRAELGLVGLRLMMASTSRPVCAIGGITADDFAELRRSGVTMAAVISAVAGAPHQRNAAQELMNAWNSAGPT